MTRYLAAPLLLAFSTATASAAATLVPLATFGGGDGWLAPADFGGSTTGNTERTFAFNPATGNLALASRQTANRVDILDGATGSLVKTMTAPAGGYTSSVLNITAVAVSTDGQIFVSNLADGSNASVGPRTLSFYSWPSESSVTAPAVSTFELTTGLRLGDSIDAIGSGASARAVLGYNDTAGATVHPGDDGFAIIDPGAGTLTTVDAASGSAGSAFRLTAAFVDADTVIGSNNGVTRIADFSGSAISSIATVTGPGTTERHVDVITIGSTQYVATLSSVDATTRNRVSIWELSGTTATLLTSANLIGTGNANVNGTGDIEWGNVTGDSATLYALTTNSGIQAFTFTVPEPSHAALAALGGLAMALRRRR